MSDTYRAVIPYESLDPLTIGSADDPSMVYRETLTLDIPEANLLAALFPDEPAPIENPTEACAAALEAPHSGPAFSEMIGPDKSLAHHHRQPVPPDADLEAAACDSRRDRGPQRQGRSAWSAPTARSSPCRSATPSSSSGGRISRAWSGSVSPSSRMRPRRPGSVRLHRHDHGRHACLAAQGGREVRRDAFHGSGPVQSLGCGRRRQAHPAGRGLGRDHRIQSLRLRHVAQDPLRRPGRADADGYRRGCHHVQALGDAQQRAGYAGPALFHSTSARTRTRTARRSASSTASTPTTGLPAGRRTSASAGSSRRPTTSSSTPAGAACPPTCWSGTAAR